VNGTVSSEVYRAVAAADVPCQSSEWNETTSLVANDCRSTTVAVFNDRLRLGGICHP